MNMLSDRSKLDFYQDSSRGRLLRALTLNDLSYWATNSFIGVVLILYVLQFIGGASATHFGLAFLVYKAVGAVLSIPVGRFYDKHKGYIDEVWGLAISSFGAGGIYIALSFATELWHLYVAMAFLGFVAIININSWRTLFYNNISKDEYSETVGTYQAIQSFGEGLALALGGFFGDAFGFDTVVFYGGIIIMLGGFIPLSIKYIFSPKK